ncbi:unnamed protein product [Staurois parvus]|uniref:Uncharacterized protein n=1 Tax=Staurois parvus TaxID=386267 RepID=A0ABN9GT99_9NEOB|nr:unnamed protein product [Staurois parvus]
MYINGRTGALPKRVDISKCHPHSFACARSLGALHRDQCLLCRDLCVRSRFM